MIQTPYLKGVSYCDHRHNHYRYIGRTNNNSLKKRSNKAYNIDHTIIMNMNGLCQWQFKQWQLET
jgi:hypothetical protein